MSQPAFNSFRAAVNGDPKLMEACRAAMLSGGHTAIVEFGRTQGFEFTAEEAKAAMDHSELSDMELELVAGGTPQETKPNG